jgi:predicted XRE-type DNA-binding protein
VKKHKIKSPSQLSDLLGLTKSDAIEAELKSELMGKIRDLISKKKLTHQEVADLSGVGRTVITGIVNASIQRITIDRLFRVIVSLGLKPEIKYKKSA